MHGEMEGVSLMKRFRLVTTLEINIEHKISQVYNSEILGQFYNLEFESTWLCQPSRNMQIIITQVKYITEIQEIGPSTVVSKWFSLTPVRIGFWFEKWAARVCINVLTRFSVSVFCLAWPSAQKTSAGRTHFVVLAAQVIQMMQTGWWSQCEKSTHIFLVFYFGCAIIRRAENHPRG